VEGYIRGIDTIGESAGEMILPRRPAVRDRIRRVNFYSGKGTRRGSAAGGSACRVFVARACLKCVTVGLSVWGAKL